jgi:hypothetical protein
MLAGMKCRFEGHATQVRIQGTGSVQLTTREAFSAPKLEVQIDAGGEAGHVRGTVDGAPECMRAWCDIAWTKGQAKKVSVKPAAGGSAAVPVTGAPRRGALQSDSGIIAEDPSSPLRGGSPGDRAWRESG